MITPINRYEMRDRLMNDEDSRFSPMGAYALSDWLDTFMPEDAVFNLVEIRGQWSEYRDFYDLASNYDCCPKDKINHIRRWFLDRTAIIEFTGGVIIREF